MANIKFSAFTQKVASADVDFIVGYTGTDNVRIAPSVLDDRYVLKTGDTMTGALQMGASFAAQIPINFGDVNFQISTENNYTAANLDNLKFKVPDAATGGFRFTNANDDEIFFAQGDGKVGVNSVTPQKTLDVNLGGNTGIGASFGGTISAGEYQGIHLGYSELGNTNYRKSAIVFERDDSATGNAQGNIYILNNVQNNDSSATLSDQRIKISKNTNIGIGEDVRPQYPEAKLTVNSDPGNTSQPDRITTSVIDSHTGLFLNGTGNAINEKYGLQFGWYSGYSTGGIFVVGDNVAGSTSGDITFDMGDGTSAGSLVERMRLTHEGNLGIGTDSPDCTLEVENTPAQGSQTMMLHLDNNPVANEGSGYLQITSGTNTQAALQIEQVSSGGSGIFGNNYLDSSFINRGVSASAYGNINFATGSSTSATSIVMTIGGGSQKGNVGIGTITPDRALEVENSSGIGSMVLTGTTGSTLYFRPTASYSPGGNFGILATGGAGPDFLSTMKISGYSTSAGGVNTIMTLLGSGSVGIGTASPDSRLDVVASDVNVTPNSESSAVFRRNGNNYISILSNSNNFGGILFGEETDANDGALSYDHLNGNMIFETRDAERMRINASGDILFGTTSETNSHAYFSAESNSRMVLTLGAATTSASTIASFKNSNGVVGSISVENSATAFNTSSDYRLKEDLKDFNGLDKVSKIPVYDFKWKVDDSRSYGVLAHELQEVLPDAVNGVKDAEEMQGVDYSKIVPLLIKSIQELKAEVESLKNK